ncbi:hypothetical protein ACLBWZ_17160 [Brucellaceae bacterium C25G]
MHFWTRVFQKISNIEMVQNSKLLQQLKELKTSTEEVEKRKKRREKPSEEQMLWCWKHRGIW